MFHALLQSTAQYDTAPSLNEYVIKRVGEGPVNCWWWDPCQAREGPKISPHRGRGWQGGPGTVSSKRRHLNCFPGPFKVNQAKNQGIEDNISGGRTQPLWSGATVPVCLLRDVTKGSFRLPCHYSPFSMWLLNCACQRGRCGEMPSVSICEGWGYIIPPPFWDTGEVQECVCVCVSFTYMSFFFKWELFS